MSSEVSAVAAPTPEGAPSNPSSWPLKEKPTTRVQVLLCILMEVVLFALLWTFLPLSEFENLLDVSVLKLLTTAPIFMVMFAIPVMIWADNTLTRDPADLTGKGHVLTVLAIGMLGAAIGGLFIYPLKFAALSMSVKAGFDAILGVCGALGSTGLSMLTGQSLMKQWDKAKSKEKKSSE